MAHSVTMTGLSRVIPSSKPFSTEQLSRCALYDRQACDSESSTFHSAAIRGVVLWYGYLATFLCATELTRWHGMATCLRVTLPLL